MSDRSKEHRSGSRKMAPEPYSFLPETQTWPLDPPEPTTEGWWKDPLSSTSGSLMGPSGLRT